MEPRREDKTAADAVSDPVNVTVEAEEDGLRGILKTIFRHPMIIICCLYANVGSLMYGFDNLTLSLCLSMDPFLEQFGDLTDGAYVIPAYWQSLWNAMPQLTTGIGAWAAGPIADRFGRRAAFITAGFISAAGVAVVYTASTRGVFLGGKMLNAVGLGLALTTGQIYIAEIAPLKFRGVALSIYTFTMNLGYLVAASVAFKRVSIPNQSSYKVLFATEWIWPGLMILGGLLLVPETPYHLTRRGLTERATKSLTFLYGKATPVEPILATISDTIEHESYLGDSVSFRECFRGIHWRRTRIVLYCNGLSQMIGATFFSNAPYFMISAGMSPSNIAMIIEMGIGLAIIGSAFTFWALPNLGRRPMMMGGTLFAAVLFFIMGVASSVPNQSSKTLWCTGISLQLVWLCMGPVVGPAMAVAGEVSAVRLRAKTAAIGFFFNYIYSTVWNVVVPYMYNTDEGNLQGKMGWIYFATCLISIVVVWFEVPELKDISFADIDERFEMRVATRAFKNWRDVTGPQTKAAALGEVELEQIE
ncbi:hypothetical protein SEUCBS140593_010691 [Sporothrix eucalyptigena]|uniref:Major facilitator superfamily (MFS) profile domain-containing protein n=1 Tax=Sporothrix eucalyptigena TaxID=1812306 RepID=A0ABP0D4L3_9PEZI